MRQHCGKDNAFRLNNALFNNLHIRPAIIPGLGGGGGATVIGAC
jgi:hypothetical protein